MCPAGTYSLADPYSDYKCPACSPGATCYGGSKIAPNPGFWRFSEKTSHIVECREDSACLYF